MRVDPLGFLRGELAELERRGLLRERAPGASQLLDDIVLCSNDYLGYRATGRLDEFVRAAVGNAPVGAGASRLVSGDHGGHRGLEECVSKWLGCQESLVFTSGYAANVGALSALAGEGDLIVSDALNHASIIDGCRLSRARVEVAPHNDLEAVRTVLQSTSMRRRFVVTESYFSMDGDSPDLRGLRALCDEHDAALVLDEAHALGAMGPRGRGLAAETGVVPDVLIGTLGKALAAQGAFIAGSSDLIRWLWNRARSFVFSTGLSPLIAEVSVSAVREAESDEPARVRLAEISGRMRQGLQRIGIDVANKRGPILPILLGSEQRALQWSAALRRRGVVVQAIRPPTVPAATSRLRLTVRADLTDAEVERALQAFQSVAAEVAA